MLTKDGARSEPALNRSHPALGDNRRHPVLGDNSSHAALQHRTIILKEHYAYEFRIVWTTVDKMKIVRV